MGKFRNEEESFLQGAANAVKYFFNAVGKISYKTSFKVFSIILLLSILVVVVRIAVSKNTVEKLVETALVEVQSEEKGLEIRELVSPKIQKRCAKMVNTLNADRAFVIENHNGKRNATELPFKYFDMTYEEVNEDKQIRHISDAFNEVLISHYKLPFYLVEHREFMATAKELEKIDQRFAFNFTDFDGAYIAIMVLRGQNKEIGFLGVSYDVGTEVADEKLIRKTLNVEAKVISELLDLNVQERIFEKQKKNASNY